MEGKAIQKYVRISPRKLRLVADVVRKISPAKALEMLPYLQKRAALPIRKTIKSAVSNAEGKGAKLDNLVFKEIQIMEGPTLKRGIPVARGRYHPILKRTSHIKVVVKTKEEKKKNVAQS